MTQLFLFQRHKLFYSFLIAIFGLGASLLLCTDKTSSFVLLNSFHCNWLNRLFAYYTNLGDGLFAIALFIVLLSFKKHQVSFSILMSFITSGLMVQAIKRIFPCPRPKCYFEATQYHYQHFIDGITLAGNSSFPSGHTATAFAICSVLIFLMCNKHWQSFMLLSAAILVGYSRIYLAQHFLMDVMVGILVGVGCAIVSILIVNQFRNIIVAFRLRR